MTADEIYDAADEMIAAYAADNADDMNHKGDAMAICKAYRGLTGAVWPQGSMLTSIMFMASKGYTLSRCRRQAC